MIDAGFDVFDYTITDKDAAQITKELSQVDIIYMSGGNTNYLLQKSQELGFIPLIRKFVQSDKPYISTNARSIITGPMIPPYMWGDEFGQPKISDYIRL